LNPRPADYESSPSLTTKTHRDLTREHSERQGCDMVLVVCPGAGWCGSSAVAGQTDALYASDGVAAAPNGLCEWLPTRLFQLRVERVPSELLLLRLDVVEVKQSLQDIEVPFSLAWLDLYDLSGALALDRVRREIANDTHYVKIISKAGRKLLRVQHFLNLIHQVLLRNTSPLNEEILETPTAEGGACLCAVREHLASFEVVIRQWLRELRRDRGARNRLRPDHSFRFEYRRRKGKSAARPHLPVLTQDDDQPVTIVAARVAQCPRAVGIPPKVDLLPCALRDNMTMRALHLDLGRGDPYGHCRQPSIGPPRPPKWTPGLLIVYPLRSRNIFLIEMLHNVATMMLPA
jgi:hypothetical protein